MPPHDSNADGSLFRIIPALLGAFVFAGAMLALLVSPIGGRIGPLGVVGKATTPLDDEHPAVWSNREYFEDFLAWSPTSESFTIQTFKSRTLTDGSIVRVSAADGGWIGSPVAYRTDFEGAPLPFPQITEFHDGGEDGVWYQAYDPEHEGRPFADGFATAVETVDEAIEIDRSWKPRLDSRFIALSGDVEPPTEPSEAVSRISVQFWDARERGFGTRQTLSGAMTRRAHERLAIRMIDETGHGQSVGGSFISDWSPDKGHLKPLDPNPLADASDLIVADFERDEVRHLGTFAAPLDFRIAIEPYLKAINYDRDLGLILEAKPSVGQSGYWLTAVNLVTGRRRPLGTGPLPFRSGNPIGVRVNRWEAVTFASSHAARQFAIVYEPGYDNAAFNRRLLVASLSGDTFDDIDIEWTNDVALISEAIGGPTFEGIEGRRIGHRKLATYAPDGRRLYVQLERPKALFAALYAPETFKPTGMDE